MRTLWIIGLGIMTSAWIHAEEALTAPDLNTENEKISYSVGVDIGKNLKLTNFQLNAELLARGLVDVFKGAEPALSSKQMEEAMATFRKKLVKTREALRAQGNKSKGSDQAEGEKFLAANEKKEGVVSLPSGLQYNIIKRGNGPIPRATQTVETHYRGTLINGTEFDSSYRRGKTVSFPVNRVIKGWQEALQLMPVGSKWQLVIPSGLAYGKRGSPPKIGPNATLLFDIELISIKK